MNKKNMFSLLFALILSTVVVRAQSVLAVSTPQEITAELLNQLTVERGEKIDTAAVRQLFHPNAQLNMLNKGDSTFLEVVGLNDFLPLLMDPYYQEGYEEHELFRIEESYGGIAHVFQSYYGQDSEGSKERGITSYQLVNLDGRWWIISLLWNLETDEHPIPNKYLGK